jgi:hypothetical protein
VGKKIELDFQLNRPQFDAYQVFRPGVTIFTGWGRGVGKSWFHRFLWWNLVAQWDGVLRTEALKPFRGVRIAILMPTLKQFKDVHLDGIQNELEGDWSFLRGKVNAQTGSVRFPGGSWIKPMPARLYTSKTARGLRCDLVDSDECDDIDAEAHDGVAVPWLSEPWSLNMEAMGGTPTRGRHGLWWRMLEDGRKGARLRAGEDPEVVGVDEENVEAIKSIFAFHATYRDAPETVSPKAVAKAKATTPKATFEREWEANPDAGEGLIYQEFDPDFHVRKAPDWSTFNEFLVGADFGDVDPAVLLLIGIQGHGNDATAWCLDEWYEPGTLNSVWDERAKVWRNATFYPDPSRQDRVRDWRSFNLRVEDIPPDVKPIAAGIGRVADMLFRRKQEYERGGELRVHEWAHLYFDPKCKNVIREMGLYRRRKMPDGSFSEDPVDKDNHALDALRYALASRFGRAPNSRHVTSGR